MTPLERILIARIKAHGPMSIADYMGECLLHPQHGYYSTGTPFGAAGDFITAPDISQMFGELLGLFLAQCWMDQGQPSPFILAEIGPGRGTLMADLLRATKAVPGFHAAARLHLIEASPKLRAQQKTALSGYQVTWLDQIHDLPLAPLFLVANEFFDALPIRQFLRQPNGWSERRIGLQEGALCFGLSDPAPIDALAHRLTDTQTGDLVEFCAPAQTIASEIATRIATHGGVALYIDYGDWRSVGDTFQALKDHEKLNPLASPGQADLTAHVDFQALAHAGAAAGPVRHTDMTPQGEFLERLGITQRAQTLARKLTGQALENHISAHRRLTHPQEMGTLFKTLACYPATAPLPPGFAS